MDQNSPQQPAQRIDALGAALVVAGQGFQALSLGGIALFLPIIRQDVGLTFTQAGAIAAAGSLVYAGMQIPSGFLADRLGARRLFLIGLTAANLLALSFSQLRAFPAMALNQALSGFFRSFTFASGLLLMTSSFPARRRATAMGLFVAGGFSSSIFLNLVGPLLVGPLGWRRTFVLFALAGLIVIALLWRFGPAGPLLAGAGSASFRDILRLVRLRLMWLVAGIQFVRLAVVSGLNFWVPTLIVVEKPYPLAVAGGLVALSSALTAPCNFLGGYLSDRLGRPLLVIGGAQAVLAVTTLLLGRVESLPLLIAVVAVGGIFQQLFFGPLFSVPIELLGSRNAGLTSGYGNFFANLGGFTSAYLLGAVRDATGSFGPALDVLAALCLGGLVCTVALSLVRPRGPRTAATIGG
jgi:MFS family permease